ncbi:MAG: hypothetical protein WB778_06250 [Thermoplasmata archaeon]
MEADNRPSHRVRRLSAVVITLALIIAVTAGAGAWYLFSESHPNASSKSDGPTFYQAIASVNGSVANISGGPWTLFGVWGIASPLPFAPNALGWFENNLTVNSCGAQFNGLTLWNGSIPLFNGSFDSGTAPFWQFAFYSNSSQSILIATNVLGFAKVYPPMAMTSECAKATGLGADPWNWSPILIPFPPNSPIMAESAWNAIGEKWMAQNPAGFERYVFGYSYWGSGNPIGRTIGYLRCGEVGATAVQPVVDVILNDNGTSNSFFNGTQGCGNVISLGPPPVLDPYGVNFSAPSLSEGNGTTYVNVSFQATHDSGNDTDAGGLVSWMATLRLNNSTGVDLPSVIPDCSTWVPSLSDCRADGSGWYAVLLSSSGKWIDSFPSISNGTVWNIPNVSIVSNQYLVIVAPSSWDVTGDNLSVYGTSPAATVGGSVTL